jgi:hypothetical protein
VARHQPLEDAEGPDELPTAKRRGTRSSPAGVPPCESIGKERSKPMSGWVGTPPSCARGTI